MKLKPNILVIYSISALVLITILRVYLLHPKNEFDKVIQHYRQKGNNEKVEAARFLKKNARWHFSYTGERYEACREAYIHLGDVSESERNETMRKGLSSIKPGSVFRIEGDEDNISAEFLIKHIDFAYDLWKNSRWLKDVNFENFCEYILPYKYSNEEVSDYLEEYNKIYSPLLENIYFEGGVKYPAIDQNPDSSSIIKNRGNSYYTLVRLLPHSGSLTFKNIEIGQEGSKNLFIQYVNGNHKNTASIIINKRDTIKADLKALNSWYSFPNKRLKIPVHLVEGQNMIEIKDCQDTIAIESIEITPYEKYYLNDKNYKITDGANYIITNLKNNECLEIENGSKDEGTPLICGMYRGMNYQHFNIQNVSYAFFKIAPAHIDKYADCLEVLSFSKENKAGIVKCHYHKAPNQEWAIIPVAPGQYKILNKWSGKSMECLPDSKQVVQSEYKGLASQIWTLKRSDNKIYFDKEFHSLPNSLSEVADRITKELDFEWMELTANLPPLPAVDILKTKTGSCVLESRFKLYVLRSLGIPAAVDFYPPGPNSSTGHMWDSVILNKNNKTNNGQVEQTPKIGYNNDIPITKVFRTTFSTNPNSLGLDKDKNEMIPPFFSDVHLTDVTDEYCPTVDIPVDLFKAGHVTYKHAYLCVFDRGNWAPVWWSRISKNRCLFPNMGLSVLYIPAYYTKSENIQVCGYPFYISNDSTINKVIACTDTTQTLVIKRKYPWRNNWLDGKMDNGQFQAANKTDFSDAVTLYTFKGNAEPLFYNLPVSNRKKFKYARYLGANGSHSTLCELSFIDESGNEIQGTPIGTSGSFGNAIEKAFDKDILTYFDGSAPDSTWVGLKFRNPAQIKTIRFIPRNDGNCIEINDTYELEYWNNKEWESLGFQIAKTDSLIYNDCPVNAVFILHNHTKGREERIFTIDKNGKQIWW